MSQPPLPAAQARFDDVDLDALRRRRTVKWTLYGPEVLAAWVAEMDFSVAPAVRAALLEGVEREDFGYCEADPSALTDACSAFFAARYDWEVPPTRIFPVADVLSGLAGTLGLFVPPELPVVVPTPAYPPLFDIVRLGGRAVVEVPLVPSGGRAALDLDRIDAALADGAGAVLLCNPHNPTGRAFQAGELSALDAVVERHGARVVSDEVHAPLVYPPQRHVPYASVSDTAAAHAVTVMSASKAWNLAGLRCAQVVLSNHEDAAAWRKLPLFQVPGPTPLGLATSAAAYGSAVEWLDELVAYLDGNRRLLGRLLAEQLPAVGYQEPEATFLTWLDCAALGLEDPAAHFLHHGKVAVSDGPPFGVGFEQHVRVNIATSSALLEQIADRMAGSVHSR